MSGSPEQRLARSAASRWSSYSEVMTAARNNALNRVDADGRTGMHHAVLDRDLVVLRAAIGAGANVSARDRRDWTPLHFAAQGQDVEACQLLIAAGADINAKDDNGNTPLWRAVFESRGCTIVVELLLRANADPGIKNDHGVSAKDLSTSIANFPIDLDRIVRGAH